MFGIILGTNSYHNFSKKRMNQSSSFLTSVVAGAVAGVIATLLVMQSPQMLQKINKGGITQPSGAPQSSFVPTDSHEAAVVNVVQESKPAVVSIIITKDVPVLQQFNGNTAPNTLNPFGGFFGNGMSPFQFQVPQYQQKGTQKQEIGGGSGFLVSADGYIVTNKHVVAQSDAEYTVFTNDGKKYDAKVAATDPANDVAILKIEGSNFPYLAFGDSSTIEVGQSAIAIGNSLGEFRNTVSVGVVSGLARSITADNGLGQAEQLEEVIQTDAAINPGNSGGPLLGLNGKVLGVNVAVALGSQNIGFALPSNSVASAVDQVKSGGKISRPFLGVRYTVITPVVKANNKLSVDYGVIVVRGETAQDLAVTPGSAADKAGIVEGDIILEADGVKIDDTHSLAQIVAKKKVGNTITLKVLHKGEEKTVNATLQEIPQS